MQKEQVQLHELNHLHHPLAVGSAAASGASASQLPAADDIHLWQEQAKSPNSRRRRRASRRKSSVAAEEKQQEQAAQPSAESDAVDDNSRHRRRSSHTVNRSKQKHKVSISDGQNGSPAFQSLVDIISEMKRLPSIAITSDDDPTTATTNTVANDDQDSWKRVRRHSEPPQKREQQQQPQRLGEPVFLNSFLPLAEEEDGENNIEILVSPLNTDHHQEELAPPKRTRSQSVPNALASQKHVKHENALNRRKPLYPAHISVSEAAAAVRSHSLYSGFLKVDLQDSSEANVECDELDASIYIFGSKNRNRALNGDQVAVELVDVDEMMNEKLAKRQVRYTRRLSAMSLNGSSSVTSNGGLSSILEDNSLLLETASEIGARPRYCGRVVSILDRPKSMLFSGTLALQRPHAKTLDNGSRDKKETHSPKIIWFIPVDKRLPLVAVPIKSAPAEFIKYHEEYKNRIFLGQIQRWPVTSLHPFGLIEKEIGWMGELGVHSGVLMADHHIKDDEFSEQVCKAAANVTTKVPNEERKQRRDLSKEHVEIFTFGEAGQDLEYAFSVTLAESDGKGIYEIGIHVPDVAFWVRADTPLDREARERCCAVDLVDKRIPILPESFTRSHCNLGVDKQRLAYSVMCRFTENGVLLHAWIGKTIIKAKRHVSFKALTAEAEIILKLCKKLQLNRLEKLDGTSLAQSYTVFKLAESGYPQEIIRVDQTDNDVLLHELLILANVEVAQKISSRFPDQALLYRQELPRPSKLRDVQDYFDNVASTSSVQGLFDLVHEHETSTEKQDTLLHIIRQALPPGKYYSAGSVDISKFCHAGFGASIYTVFTEPIRNYASIHVQRQLSAALKGEGQDSENFDLIDKIARHCNSSQMLKTAAEQESKSLYTAAYIYRQCLNAEVKKITAESLVIKISADVVILYVPEYDIELSVVMNDQSLLGGHHAYDPILNKMDIVWPDDAACDDNVNLTLKFLSSLHVSIIVDMKAAKPVLRVELLRP
ncbi:hypothetical protein [Parasitella parasitica]|uniref:RNB domain-containing protein n=1 Tax=Parasitella parasitica TaxID=35722 RepID=A0A0B7MVR1_9FUNG|nr:hypothetical protein [Parasitella parasitica]